MLTVEAVSPLDGRYEEQIHEISKICNEFQVMKKKVYVEIEWLKHIVDIISSEYSFSKVHKFTERQITYLDNLYHFFSETDFAEINRIEKEETHHDIKAIETWLRTQISPAATMRNYDISFSDKHINLVHYGLTSQDVVSLSNNLILQEIVLLISKKIDSMKNSMKNLYTEDNHHIFLARTHGQYAIPTSFKREINSYLERLRMISYQFNPTTSLYGKCGGAIGNFASLKFVFPTNKFFDFLAEKFCKTIGLNRSECTTQTDEWRSLVDVCSHYTKVSSILIDFCRDIWTYFSYGYFVTNIEKGYCGSSTMPHKVNPIKFENAEGCLEKVENDFSFLAKKLSKSRLQRDLSDSVIIRTIYESFCYFYLALDNIKSGLDKISVDDDVLNKELSENYQILSEPVQLILKESGYLDGYEKSKQLFQGLISCDKGKYQRLIDKLDIPNEDLECKLYDLDPIDYYYEG